MIQAMGRGKPAPTPNYMGAIISRRPLTHGTLRVLFRVLRPNAAEIHNGLNWCMAWRNDMGNCFGQSWNLSLQKEFWGGFIAQTAYVGTRQLKISQTLDLNAGQVLGAGRNGQPFFPNSAEPSRPPC